MKAGISIAPSTQPAKKKHSWELLPDVIALIKPRRGILAVGYEKLRNIFSALDGSGADLPPTDQQAAVNKELGQKIAEARERVKMLADRETAAFNPLLKSNGLSLAIEP